jgi:hypothetical protein
MGHGPSTASGRMKTSEPASRKHEFGVADCWSTLAARRSSGDQPRASEDLSMPLTLSGQGLAADATRWFRSPSGRLPSGGDVSIGMASR